MSVCEILTCIQLYNKVVGNNLQLCLKYISSVILVLRRNIENRKCRDSNFWFKIFQQNQILKSLNILKNKITCVSNKINFGYHFSAVVALLKLGPFFWRIIVYQRIFGTATLVLLPQEIPILMDKVKN